MPGWLFVLVAVAGVLAFLLITALVFSRFYNRSTKEQAFVRTGKGGQKVIKDGGAMVIPILHEVKRINMKTLKLTVQRKETEALITKDRLRVDVTADFYVRVRQADEAIATAAQTLGEKTMNVTELKDLIEGKFVDALRSVAAGMNMDQLHENRIDFVQQVQNALNEDLGKNGLELESVSLTGLDQTDPKFFNPNNAFDAEGLKKLAEITESRRKERNDIEQDTIVAIETKNLDATRKTLEVGRDREFAEAEQARQIAEKKAEENRAAEIARISAERETEEAQIAKDKSIREAEIAREQELEAKEIAKKRAIEIANIEREEAEQTKSVAFRKAVEIANQDKAIAVAQKSEEESQARAEAERARAKAVEASEAAKTVEATAVANREADISVIKERGEAERDAAKILVAAEAERKAAEDRAAAKLVAARAEKDSVTILAEADAGKVKLATEAEADRITRLSEAKAKEYETEAAGREAINAAAEKLPQAERDLEYKLALVNSMPNIVREIAAPIGEIESFRVLDMRGADGVMSGGNAKTLTINGQEASVSGEGSGSLPQQIIDGIMKYKVSLPLVQQLAKEVGLDLDKGLSEIPNALTDGLFAPTDENVNVSVESDGVTVEPTVETTPKASTTKTTNVKTDGETTAKPKNRNVRATRKIGTNRG